MTKQNKRLADEYVTRMADLQYKRRKKQDEFILLALLLAVFIEFLSADNPTNAYRMTTLMAEKDFKNPDKMVKLIDEALDNKGKLFLEVQNFKTKNERIVTSYKSIIPQKEPQVDTPIDIQEMKERTNLFEQNSAISYMMNLTMLNKRYKTWNTQRDDKVRKTQFHSVIDGVTVGINSPFEVNGYVAMYPAHRTLPDFDRFNCRCYLTYR